METPVGVLVSVEGSDHRATRSLYRWLTQDPQVRRDAPVSLVSASPTAGEMGSTLELINVLLSNGIALSSLVVALAAWRDSRTPAPTMRIERNGVSVTVQDASPETVRRVMDALLDASATDVSATGVSSTDALPVDAASADDDPSPNADTSDADEPV